MSAIFRRQCIETALSILKITTTMSKKNWLSVLKMREAGHDHVFVLLGNRHHGFLKPGDLAQEFEVSLLCYCTEDVAPI